MTEISGNHFSILPSSVPRAIPVETEEPVFAQEVVLPEVGSQEVLSFKTPLLGEAPIMKFLESTEPNEAVLKETAPLTLTEVREGKVLKPGQRSPDVPKLLEKLSKLGYKAQGQTDLFEGDIVDALIQFQSDYQIVSENSPYSGMLGKHTLEALEQALNGPSINLNDPILKRLNCTQLNTGNNSSCVETVLKNLDRLGIKSFHGGTTADPNNSRGAMVQMEKAGHWASAKLPGSKSKTIQSTYGKAKVNVLSASEYKNLVNKGQIPNGSIIFQTRHGWDYSGGPHGNDMGIIQNGKIQNYADMGGMYVYSDLKEVVIMVPSQAVLQNSF